MSPWMLPGPLLDGDDGKTKKRALGLDLLGESMVVQEAPSEICCITQHTPPSHRNFVQLENETPVSVKDCNGRLAA